MTVIASEHINEPEIGPSKIGPSIKNTHVGFSGRVIYVYVQSFCLHGHEEVIVIGAQQRVHFGSFFHPF